MYSHAPDTPRALVLHPDLTGSNPSAKLTEAEGLALALGVEIIYSEIIPLREIKAGHFFGSGKIDEIAARIGGEKIDLIVVNGHLAPVQQRNLENSWQAKVIDRTGLILEIFALRAATKEGRLQVELARLAYERSRLVRTWTHLERQRGGGGFLAGPGETQIESDRRMLADKISRLRRDLDAVKRRREVQRRKRRRAPERVAALVGYTNAGKSTLFNLMTSGGVLAKDMLFATLDTTHRIFPLPSGRSAVLSDTVGFITDLPTHLVDAFRATLEEIKEADLLIHVRDISDPLTETHRQDVLEVLASLEAGPRFGQKLIEVWNKTDLLPENMDIQSDGSFDPASCFPVSCLSGDGIERLKHGAERALSENDVILDLQLPAKAAAARAWLHTHGDIIAEEYLDSGAAVMQVRLTPVDEGRLRARFAELF